MIETRIACEIAIEIMPKCVAAAWANHFFGVGCQHLQSQNSLG